MNTRRNLVKVTIEIVPDVGGEGLGISPMQDLMEIAGSLNSSDVGWSGISIEGADHHERFGLENRTPKIVMLTDVAEFKGMLINHD